VGESTESTVLLALGLCSGFAIGSSLPSLMSCARFRPAIPRARAWIFSAAFATSGSARSGRPSSSAASPATSVEGSGMGDSTVLLAFGLCSGFGNGSTLPALTSSARLRPAIPRARAWIFAAAADLSSASKLSTLTSSDAAARTLGDDSTPRNDSSSSRPVLMGV